MNNKNFVYKLRKGIAKMFEFLADQIGPNYMPDEFSAFIASYDYVTVTFKKDGIHVIEVM